jgi:hypothetical protein
MIVVMMMVAVVLLVGATLGIKRRFDRGEPRTEAAQHIFDHMIAPDAQPLADDLDVDMTIADMPGEAREIVGVGSGDFNERLRPADHADDGAVVEHEAVAVAERSGLPKIEQEFRAALAAQHHPSAMALMRIERNGVNGARFIPVSGNFDGARTLHS